MAVGVPAARRAGGLEYAQTERWDTDSDQGSQVLTVGTKTTKEVANE